MTSPEAVSQLLAQLDAIANAPMMPDERVSKASPLFAAAGLAAAAVATAASSAHLPWNQRKAAEYGLPVATWLKAVEAVQLTASAGPGELLDRIHQAEAAAAMLKAGYTPGRDDSGRLTWAR